MRALGKVKILHNKMYELFEILECEKWKCIEGRLEFLDYPGKVGVEAGDKIFSWYWVPVRRQVRKW